MRFVAVTARRSPGVRASMPPDLQSPPDHLFGGRSGAPALISALRPNSLRAPNGPDPPGGSARIWPGSFNRGPVRAALAAGGGRQRWSDLAGGRRSRELPHRPTLRPSIQADDPLMADELFRALTAVLSVPVRCRGESARINDAPKPLACNLFSQTSRPGDPVARKRARRGLASTNRVMQGGCRTAGRRRGRQRQMGNYRRQSRLRHSRTNRSVLRRPCPVSICRSRYPALRCDRPRP